MQKTTIIGIGNKARNGKDTFANYFKALDPDNIIILHWAHALKEELKNNERRLPLILQLKINGLLHYLLLDNDNNRYLYDIYHDSELPSLDSLFFKRNISEYWGMDEKDPEMLQIWGTDYKRTYLNPNYWVNKLHIYITKVVKKSHPRFILIPDTRFENEYNYIKEHNGYYINVSRLNFNNEDRDASHISECELDKIKADYNIIAKSGDLGTIKSYAESIYKELL